MKRCTQYMMIGAALALAACGGKNNENNTVNNTTVNNTVNNTTVNNTTVNNTVNNTTVNNTVNNTTVNNTVNNTTVNNTIGMQDCSFAEQDNDGNGINELRSISYYEDEDWEHAVRVIVEQQSTPFQSNTYAVDQEWDGDNLLTQIVDFGNDGTVEWVFTWTYDADGNNTYFGFDNENDGEDDFTSTTTYDADGQVLRVEQDGVLNSATFEITEAADGTPNLVSVIEWYGVDQPLTQQVDVDNDGELEIDHVWTYDANGNMTMSSEDGFFGSNSFEDVRVEADGTPDRIVRITYDADGNVATFEEDGFFRASADGMSDLYEQQDGTPDYVEQDLTYDANGNRTGWRLDGRKAVNGEWSIRADGTFDRFQNVMWEAVANAPGEYRPVSVEFDEGDDGSVDFAQNWEHNEDGSMTHRETDGVVDDGNNLLTPADGMFQDTLDITWLDADRAAAYTRDFDGDGNLDVDSSWTFNDSDQLLLFERDGEMPPESFEYGPAGPADGNVDYRVAYTYDELGRFTSGLEEADEDGSGGLEKLSGFTQEWGACEDFSLE